MLRPAKQRFIRWRPYIPSVLGFIKDFLAYVFTPHHSKAWKRAVKTIEHKVARYRAIVTNVAIILFGIFDILLAGLFWISLPYLRAILVLELFAGIAILLFV